MCLIAAIAALQDSGPPGARMDTPVVGLYNNPNKMGKAKENKVSEKKKKIITD